MYYVSEQVQPDGAKVIDIAGRTAAGAFVDGLKVLQPGGEFLGKPYQWWKLGGIYAEDLTEKLADPAEL